jgi:hypothetical protein
MSFINPLAVPQGNDVKNITAAANSLLGVNWAAAD